MPGLEPHEDFDLIERAARDAGDIARRYFGGTYRKWDKGKGQPVTDADMEIDAFLHDTLTAARSSYGWLSEESLDDPARLDALYSFVVDPIDGTTAFMKGRPHFSISIAIVRAGRPIAGVVYNPILDECFGAMLGGGATLNGGTIHVSTCERVEGCRMLGAKDVFAHPAWNDAPNIPWPDMAIENRSSIAYRMGLVAAGRFDAALALSTKRDWDVAAGDLIVQEAGGTVTDHTGAILQYNGASTLQPSFVCANPILHAQIMKRVRHLTLPGARTDHG